MCEVADELKSELFNGIHLIFTTWDTAEHEFRNPLRMCKKYFEKPSGYEILWHFVLSRNSGPLALAKLGYDDLLNLERGSNF